MLTMQEILLGRGSWTESSKVIGEPKYSATWLAVGFMVISFRVVFVSHSGSESFLVVRTLLSKDGRQ